MEIGIRDSPCSMCPKTLLIFANVLHIIPISKSFAKIMYFLQYLLVRQLAKIFHGLLKIIAQTLDLGLSVCYLCIINPMKWN